jgi:hypothetical protein
MGIMRALDDWRNLLIRAREPFEILMDHRNLTYFQDLQKLMGCQVNWTTKLQDFDFVICHVSGESNRGVDMLSRPEGTEKVSAKVGTVLLDCFFAQFLSGREEPEGVADQAQERGKEIVSYHNSPMAGHPRVKCTLDLLVC